MADRNRRTRPEHKPVRIGTCPDCGYAVALPELGHDFHCPNCTTHLLHAEPNQPVRAETECAKCKRPIEYRRAMAQQVITCPHCRADLLMVPPGTDIRAGLAVFLPVTLLADPHGLPVESALRSRYMIAAARLSRGLPLHCLCGRRDTPYVCEYCRSLVCARCAAVGLCPFCLGGGSAWSWFRRAKRGDWSHLKIMDELRQGRRGSDLASGSRPPSEGETMIQGIESLDELRQRTSRSPDDVDLRALFATALAEAIEAAAGHDDLARSYELLAELGQQARAAGAGKNARRQLARSLAFTAYACDRLHKDHSHLDPLLDELLGMAQDPLMDGVTQKVVEDIVRVARHTRKTETEGGV